MEDLCPRPQPHIERCSPSLRTVDSDHHHTQGMIPLPVEVLLRQNGQYRNDLSGPHDRFPSWRRKAGIVSIAPNWVSIQLYSFGALSESVLLETLHPGMISNGKAQSPPANSGAVLSDDHGRPTQMLTWSVEKSRVKRGFILSVNPYRGYLSHLSSRINNRLYT
jgi:hypothetical protein